MIIKADWIYAVVAGSAVHQQLLSGWAPGQEHRRDGEDWERNRYIFLRSFDLRWYNLQCVSLIYIRVVYIYLLFMFLSNISICVNILLKMSFSRYFVSTQKLVSKAVHIRIFKTLLRWLLKKPCARTWRTSLYDVIFLLFCLLFLLGIYRQRRHANRGSQLFILSESLLWLKIIIFNLSMYNILNVRRRK